MKQSIIISILSFLSYSVETNGQVGIENNTPDGVLDIASTNKGVVYPVVSLTDLSVETVLNPNAPNIVAGTTIYNTTENAANKIYPGLYFWNGTKWIAQSGRKDNKLFIQNTSLRPESDLSNETINFNSTSFTPLYSGTYKITVTVHYGGGLADLPVMSTNFTNFVAESGAFVFTSLNGGTHTINIGSYSGNNRDKLFNGGGTTQLNYTNNINQATYVIEETLTASNPYTFGLTFSQAAAPGFQFDGNSGTGAGYISISNSILCTVEINHIEQ